MNRIIALALVALAALTLAPRPAAAQLITAAPEGGGGPGPRQITPEELHELLQNFFVPHGGEKFWCNPKGGTCLFWLGYHPQVVALELADVGAFPTPPHGTPFEKPVVGVGEAQRFAFDATLPPTPGTTPNGTARRGHAVVEGVHWYTCAEAIPTPALARANPKHDPALPMQCLVRVRLEKPRGKWLFSTTLADRQVVEEAARAHENVDDPVRVIDAAAMVGDYGVSTLPTGTVLTRNAPWLDRGLVDTHQATVMGYHVPGGRAAVVAAQAQNAWNAGTGGTVLMGFWLALAGLPWVILTCSGARRYVRSRLRWWMVLVGLALAAGMVALLGPGWSFGIGLGVLSLFWAVDAAIQRHREANFAGAYGTP